MIEKSDTVPSLPIMVLTCCTYSGKDRVAKVLRRYGVRFKISQELNKPSGTGTTVTVLATPEAAEWVELLLVRAGFGLLSVPRNPENKQYYIENQSALGLKAAHEQIHHRMPTAWNDPKYRPPVKTKPTQQKHKSNRPNTINKLIKDWLG